MSPASGPRPGYDRHQVIKQDRFGLRVNHRFGLAEKGVLTLFRDRLEWEGSRSYSLPLPAITDVKVLNQVGQSLLIVKCSGTEFRFEKADHMVTGMAILLGPLMGAVVSRPQGLEAWQELIDKLRLGL